MAGSLLLLPAGSGASVGSVALYRVESGARRLGEEGGSVDMVQCGSALWSGNAERDIRFEGMAGKLDCQYMAAVPRGRRDGIQADGDSSVHPHRAAAGERRVCAGSRKIDEAAADTTKRRAAS